MSHAGPGDRTRPPLREEWRLHRCGSVPGSHRTSLGPATGPATLVLAAVVHSAAVPDTVASVTGLAARDRRRASRCCSAAPAAARARSPWRSAAATRAGHVRRHVAADRRRPARAHRPPPRRAPGWPTIEEPHDLAGALAARRRRAGHRRLPDAVGRTTCCTAATPTTTSRRSRATTGGVPPPARAGPTVVVTQRGRSRRPPRDRARPALPRPARPGQPAVGRGAPTWRCCSSPAGRPPSPIRGRTCR